MEFEKTLRERFYNQVLDSNISNLNLLWNKYPISKEYLSSKNFRAITAIYSIYLERKLKDKTETELFKLCDEFEDATSPQSLMELRKNIELSEDEKSYIMYKSMCQARFYGCF